MTGRNAKALLARGLSRRHRSPHARLPFQMALDVWLVMHRDLKSEPRVRLMFDWLAAGLTDYVKRRTEAPWT